MGSILELRFFSLIRQSVAGWNLRPFQGWWLCTSLVSG